MRTAGGAHFPMGFALQPDRATPVFPETGRASRWQCCVLIATLVVAACSSSAPTTHGAVEGDPFTRGQWLQSDSNRMATLAMEANLDSLRLLAGKLYRRNPSQWRKTALTQAEAEEKLELSILGLRRWPGLEGRSDVAALSHALSAAFEGDRVAAFIAACADTIITAHGGKRDFYYLDGVDPQFVFNAARNMEIALWILNTRRDTADRPLLLANAMSDGQRNLSFEREFGKIIGRLDLVAAYATERYRRAGIAYVQGLVAAPLLAFLPVR